MKHMPSPLHKLPSLRLKWPASSAQQLFIGSIIILALSLGTLGYALWVQHSTVRPTLPAAGYAVGQQVPSGKVTLTVVNTKSSAGIPHMMAPQGMQYVVVTISVRNNSRDSINVIPSTDTYVKDAAGNISYLTPYALTNPFHAGALPAGETVKGELSYLVHKNTALKFYADGIWSGGVVPFKVQ